MDTGSQEITCNWEYRLFTEYCESHDATVYILDADHCPVCDGKVINAEIKESTQFVHTTDSFSENLGHDVEHSAFRNDDGPHGPRLISANCGQCGRVLYTDN